MYKKLITFFLLGILSNIYANAPQIFRYQGRLVENNALVNAALPISFKLYDNITDGSLLYEDSATVTVIDGLYSTYIGDDTVSGSMSNALTADSVYLEITINGQTLSPREQLVSVPYALNTESSSAPSGSIIMSTNYPNAALEALGYVPLEYDGVNLINALALSNDFEPAYTFNNSIWFVEERNTDSDFRLAKTTDGSLFEFYSPGTNMSWIEDEDFLVLNDQIIALPEQSLNGWGYDAYYKVGISADGQNWNTYTNNLYGNNIDSRLVWNNALYVFIRSSSSNIVARSINGINFTTVYSSSSSETSGEGPGLYTSDSYIFYTQIDEMNGTSTNIYSSNGIDWQPVPNGNIDFVPDDDAFVSHNGVLWAVDENEYDGNNLGDADLMKSVDGGITWTEVIELYYDYEDYHDDNELYVAGDSVWLSIESDGDLYTLTNEDTLNLEINGSSGDGYYVSELANSSVFVIHEKNDSHIATYTTQGSIKYKDGLYYYIKE